MDASGNRAHVLNDTLAFLRILYAIAIGCLFTYFVYSYPCSKIVMKRASAFLNPTQSYNRIATILNDPIVVLFAFLFLLSEDYFLGNLQWRVIGASGVLEQKGLIKRFMVGVFVQLGIITGFVLAVVCGIYVQPQSVVFSPYLWLALAWIGMAVWCILWQSMAPENVKERFAKIWGEYKETRDRLHREYDMVVAEVRKRITEMGGISWLKWTKLDERFLLRRKIVPQKVRLLGKMIEESVKVVRTMAWYTNVTLFNTYIFRIVMSPIYIWFAFARKTSPALLYAFYISLLMQLVVHVPLFIIYLDLLRERVTGVLTSIVENGCD